MHIFFIMAITLLFAFSSSAQLTKLMEWKNNYYYQNLYGYPPVVNGYVYFDYDGILWKTDGTAEHTREVHHFAIDILGECGVNLLVEVGNKIYFQQCNQLLATDATDDHTENLYYLSKFGSSLPIGVNDQLCFVDWWRDTNKTTYYNRIVVTDGTKTGTKSYDSLFLEVKGIDTYRLNYNNGYFYVSTPKSVLTTQLRKETTHAICASKGYISSFFPLANKAIFSTSTHTSAQVFVSDGTLEGTLLLKEFTNQGQNIAMYKAGESILISVPQVDTISNHGVNDLLNYNIYKTDGTVSGTSLIGTVQSTHVLNVITNTNNSLVATTGPLNELFKINHANWSLTSIKKTALNFKRFCVFKNDLIFTEEDTLHTNLYKLTYSAGTTEFITNLPGSVTTFRQAKDFLYMIYDDHTHGEEPWITDGTASGTKMIQDLFDGPNGSQSLGYILTTIDNKFIFMGKESSGIRYLWSYYPELTGVDKLVWQDQHQTACFYPSPASTDIYFYRENYGQRNIHIYDSKGMLVLEKKFSDNNLNVSHLESGIYSVRIISENESKVQKLVIQK